MKTRTLFIAVILLVGRIDAQPIISERVNDLISKMTLEEKISQLVNNTKEIKRLGIPEYNWWNESLHGVARSGVATVFPQAIGLAATWDTPLMFQTADVISTEARAKYNYFIKNGERDIFKGLTFWSPNINIFRDPRWGRGQETYGEDPYLTSRMGVAFIKGLQGDDPNYFKVIATPKHYAVHSGPEPVRHEFDAVIDSRDLYETYLPAFESCIKEAGAFSIMCAYNRFMGEACCGSGKLLKKILRDDWVFKGYVVSDCGAIEDIYLHHKITDSEAEAAALSIKSGTDLCCGKIYATALIEAVNKGLLTEKEIDVSVKRLFTARFRLGMFDPPEMVKYSNIPIGENDSEEHRLLSLKSARESIVLLKNENNTLPLKKDVKKIAVIGPTADSYFMLLGNYYGTPSRYTTPLQGIKNGAGKNTEIVYEQGCNLVEEGGIRNYVASDFLSTGKEKGLTVEYFKNKELSGEPFYKRTDVFINPNWVYGSRQPAFPGSAEFSSLRWTGTITPAVSGEYNFEVKSDGGYRLYINNKLLINDWGEDSLSVINKSIPLEGGKPYDFKLEFCLKTGRPQLFIQWELMNRDNFKNAIETAKTSDVIVFVGGITAQLEGEEMRVDYEGFKGGDRTSLNLPAVQERLLKELQKTGKPVILVLTSGSALSVNWEEENLPAIVQLWYPGEEGGRALADVLFGDYNPGGRLPVTFYKSVEQLPAFEDYNMKGRTYRFFKGDALYPFGYGLSYTSFRYSNLRVAEKINTGESFQVSADVENAGKLEGDEVVELYLKGEGLSEGEPIQSLQGFKRIHLGAGEKQSVQFTVAPRQISIFGKEGKFVSEAGTWEIFVGGTQPGTKCATTEYISKKMKITGEPVIVKE
jgi:beta-glucosidase